MPTWPSKLYRIGADLSGRGRKLFDGHADGVIDDRNYEMLMTDIQSEQAALAARLAEIDASMAVKTNAVDQLERLKQGVCKCLTLTELTPLILNKLIERIEIGSVETVDGQKQQWVTIVWRFAGMV